LLCAVSSSRTLSTTHFFLMLSLPQPSPLFPYTTLFRSVEAALRAIVGNLGRGLERNKLSLADLFGQEENLGPTTRAECPAADVTDRKSTRLNSSHVKISYAVFCLKKKKLSRNLRFTIRE